MFTKILVCYSRKSSSHLHRRLSSGGVCCRRSWHSWDSRWAGGQPAPFHTDNNIFSLQTSGTCLEQESGSWNQSPVGGLQSWDLKSLTKILLGAANGHTITIIALYLAFNCSATSLAGLHRFLQNHTLFVYSPNCWE